MTVSGPPERLLVFKATEGWQPLCDFLGVPIPKEDFPSTNDTQHMRRQVRIGAGIAYALLITSVGLVAWLISLAFLV